MSEELHYHIEESGEGPPLVLLHGFTGSCESWRRLVPRLNEQFQVICIDLPGHGRTPAPADPAQCALPVVANDIARILVEHGAAPAHLLGYSMGARLALGVALLHPGVVRSLILESGSPGLASEAERAGRRASDTALAERIERDGISVFVDEWERLPLWESQRRLPTNVRQWQRAQRLRNHPEGLAASLRGMGTGAQPSYWDDLLQLAVPALLITGALDQKFTAIAEEMRVRCPACTHVIIADAGHTPHLEQPEAFVAQVGDFLTRCHA